MNLTIVLVLSFVLLTLLNEKVQSFSTGAGSCSTPGSCMSFSQNNGVVLSFNNGGSRTIESGKTYNVTLTSTSGQDLAGWLLYAQDSTQFRQGLWTLKPNTQFKSCSGTSGSSITHTTATGWGTSQTFLWTAPVPAVNLALQGVGVRKNVVWSNLSPIQLTAATGTTGVVSTGTTGVPPSTGTTRTTTGTTAVQSTGTTRTTTGTTATPPSTGTTSSSSTTGSQAALTIKLSGPKEYTTGQQANITVKITNDAATSLQNVVASFKIKKKISLVSVDGGCKAKGSGFECAISQLNGGQTLTYTAKVQVDGDGKLTASVLDSADVTLQSKSLNIKPK